MFDFAVKYANSGQNENICQVHAFSTCLRASGPSNVFEYDSIFETECAQFFNCDENWSNIKPERLSQIATIKKSYSQKQILKAWDKMSNVINEKFKRASVI